MCGRYTYLFQWKQLHRLMGLVSWPEVELTPRYNVAPMQEAPIVRADEQHRRVGTVMRWGLVPSWAEDPSIGNRMINARGETAAEKPAFRSAFARRRCLVPISGFYEWQAVKERKTKQPYWIGRADRQPFALAGLWERWEKGDEPLETFTILTTDANDLLRPIHHRMPVILSPEDYGEWLDPSVDAKHAKRLIRPAAPTGFESVPISTRVNSPKNDDPSVVEPLGAADGRDSSLFGSAGA